MSDLVKASESANSSGKASGHIYNDNTVRFSNKELTLQYFHNQGELWINYLHRHSIGNYSPISVKYKVGRIGWIELYYFMQRLRREIES